MLDGIKAGVGFVAVVAAILLGVAFFLSWERPPIESTQIGHDGVAMVQHTNPRLDAELQARNEPPISMGQMPPGGQPAGEVYENVQVLGSLSEDQFNQLMVSITNWVAPEQGCAYCHNVENMASDEVYTKLVARRMIQMTQHINANYESHVKQTGVSCYTCHRGQNVPQYLWVEEDGPKSAKGMTADRQGQNVATEIAVYASLPYTALEDLLTKPGAQIRVQDGQALPTAPLQGGGIKQAEVTYSLMMNMSDGLGVNCTYCHNTRAFANWEQSPPARATAWHGIQMAQDVNANYLMPLQSTLPAHRLGPAGDAPKAACETCHQGLPKPMNGAPMLEDHPELGRVME